MQVDLASARRRRRFDGGVGHRQRRRVRRVHPRGARARRHRHAAQPERARRANSHASSRLASPSMLLVGHAGRLHLGDPAVGTPTIDLIEMAANAASAHAAGDAPAAPTIVDRPGRRPRSTWRRAACPGPPKVAVLSHHNLEWVHEALHRVEPRAHARQRHVRCAVPSPTSSGSTWCCSRRSTPAPRSCSSIASTPTRASGSSATTA